MNDLIIQNPDGLPTRRALHRQLDGLHMPADAKVAIAELIDITAIAGDQAIEIGRRIVAFAFELMRQFPNLSFCTIIAVLINALIASVPILGPMLQAFIGPFVLAAGLGIGALLELRDGDLRGRVDLLTSQFEAIFA